MPFDWYQVRSSATAKEQAKVTDRRNRDRDVAEHAALLLRLGYSAEHAIKRITTNLAWDYEVHAPSTDIKGVEAIIRDVYKRRSVAGGGAPSV